MRVPAVCDNCGMIFPSDFEVKNSTNISFYGCGSGPCPGCGGNGHIPDGVYNFIGNSIELLSGPSRTVSELERLATILRQSRQEGSSLAQVGKRIQDEVPELSSLKDILPKSRSELYAFIAVILAIISLVLGQLKQKDPPKVEINQLVNVIYQQEALSVPKRLDAKSAPAIQTKVKEKPNKEIGRNSPCPCGSGKKYKKCCLNKNSE